MFVNRVKVGQALYPLNRPGYDEATGNFGKWLVVDQQLPLQTEDAEGRLLTHGPPYLMVGCHRNVEDKEFRDFSYSNSIFDEVAIWLWRLETNCTHDETLYFDGGYGNSVAVLLTYCNNLTESRCSSPNSS